MGKTDAARQPTGPNRGASVLRMADHRINSLVLDAARRRRRRLLQQNRQKADLHIGHT
jgi:hypothetical protein